MMITRIVLIRSGEAFKGIVIIYVQASAIFAGRTVKPWTQILCWTRYFRAGFHSDTTGEPGSNHHRLAASGHSFKLYYAFIHIYLGEAAAIHFHVKLCAAHGDHCAGRPNLECRGSAEPLLNLRAHAPKHDLKIFPA